MSRPFQQRPTDALYRVPDNLPFTNIQCSEGMTPRVTVNDETYCCPAGTYPGWNNNVIGCFRYSRQNDDRISWCVPWKFEEQQCKNPFHKQHYRPRYNVSPEAVDAWPKIKSLVNEKQMQYNLNSK